MKSNTTTLRTLLIIMSVISMLMVLLFFVSAIYSATTEWSTFCSVMENTFLSMAVGIGPVAALTVLLFSHIRTLELEAQGISQKKWKIANASLIGALTALVVFQVIIGGEWLALAILLLPLSYSVAGILVVTNIFRALCPNALDRFWAWKWGKPLTYTFIAIAVIAFAAVAIWDIQEKIEVASKFPHKSTIEMFK